MVSTILIVALMLAASLSAQPNCWTAFPTDADLCRPMYVFYEEFNPTYAFTNGMIGSYGWNAGGTASASGWNAGDTTHPGAVQFRTAAGADGYATLFLEPSGFLSLGSNPFDFKIILKSSSNGTNQVQQFIGFADGFGLTSDNQLGFSFANSSGCASGNASDTGWVIRASKATVATSSTSNMPAMALNTWYTFRIRSVTPGTVLFSACAGANCQIQPSSEVSISSTNVPTAALFPVFYQKNCDGSVKDLYIDVVSGFMKIYR